MIDRTNLYTITNTKMCYPLDNAWLQVQDPAFRWMVTQRPQARPFPNY